MTENEILKALSEDKTIQAPVPEGWADMPKLVVMESLTKAVRSGNPLRHLRVKTESAARAHALALISFTEAI